jgi:ferric-dicitrate binding protein FerR (iron transport regulator)
MSEDEHPLDEALARKLRQAADAHAQLQDEAPLDQAARARVLAAMLRETAPLLERARRRRRVQAASLFALAASLSLALWLREPRDRTPAAPVAVATPCALPASLEQARFLSREGRQLLSLGRLGSVAADADAALRVVSASACELIIELEHGTLAADMQDLRPARLTVQTRLGDVHVKGTTFSVQLQEQLEVALLKGAVEVVSRREPERAADGALRAAADAPTVEVSRLSPGQQLARASGSARAQIAHVSSEAARVIGELIRPSARMPSTGTPVAQAPAPEETLPQASSRARPLPSATQLLASAESARRAGNLVDARASYRLAGALRGADAEVALLRWARLELSDKQPDAAERVLATYQQRFPHGRLGEEASWLSLRTLELLGRHAEASEQARSLMHRFPDSPHARAARRLLPP